MSPFPKVSCTLYENFQPFSSKLNLSSANSFSLEESKICHLGKGYMAYKAFFMHIIIKHDTLFLRKMNFNYHNAHELSVVQPSSSRMIFDLMPLNA